MFLIALFVISVLSFGLFLAFSRAVRGIVSQGSNSDATKQIASAARYKEWKHLCDMHLFAGEKAWMKDVGVVGLVIFQRLLKDNSTFYPIAVLCALANALCSVGVYVAGSLYWNVPTGLFLYGLYAFCFWPHQVALQGGYQLLSALFFLIAAILFQLGSAATLPVSVGMYAVAGFAVGLMMFSSASARKFIPLTIIAFVYSLRFHIRGSTVADQIREHSVLLASALGCSIALIALCYVATYVFVPKLYTGKTAPKLGNALFPYRSKHPVEHYIQKARSLAQSATSLIVVSLVYGTALIAFSTSKSWILSVHGAMLFGLFSAAFIFMYPRFIANAKGFWGYWTITQFHDHFRCYKDAFARKGIVMKEGFRGAGVRWYPAFFWRMTPFHTVLFAGSLIYIGASALGATPSNLTGWQAVALSVISVSSILYADWTRAFQLGRTYYPAYLGLLIPIAYTFSSLYQTLNSHWIGGLGILFVSALAAWNAHVFITDVLPARMVPTQLLQTMRTLAPQPIFVFDSPYNNNLFTAIPEELLTGLNLKRIHRLEQATSGYVLIPNTNYKDLYMETEEAAVNEIAFDGGAALEKLITTRQVARFAIQQFKTTGASRMWPQESEVTSYRDLIMHDVSEENRWRGIAWLVDVQKLKAAGWLSVSSPMAPPVASR